MFGPILVASVPRSPLCLDSLVSHLGQVLNSVPLPHPPDPPPCLPAHSASLSSGFCGGDAGCCPCPLWSSLGARPVLARSCLVLARCLWPSSFLRSIFSPLSDSHDSCASSFHPARALADPAGPLSPAQTPDWLSRPAPPAPRPPPPLPFLVLLSFILLWEGLSPLPGAGPPLALALPSLLPCGLALLLLIFHPAFLGAPRLTLISCALKSKQEQRPLRLPSSSSRLSPPPSSPSRPGAPSSPGPVNQPHWP